MPISKHSNFGSLTGKVLHLAADTYAELELELSTITTGVPEMIGTQLVDVYEENLQRYLSFLMGWVSAEGVEILRKIAAAINTDFEVFNSVQFTKFWNCYLTLGAPEMSIATLELTFILGGDSHTLCVWFRASDPLQGLYHLVSVRRLYILPQKPTHPREILSENAISVPFSEDELDCLQRFLRQLSAS